MGRHLRVVVLAASVLGLVLPVAPAAAAPADAANEHRATFIVTLRDGEPREVAAEHARRYDADVEFVYEHALRGYAATMSEARIGELARDGRVERIERDQVVHANESPQVGPTWGLDRVDQRPRVLDGSYTYAATGFGVTAYIIDTGILNSHSDFSGRAEHGYDAVDKDFITTDCNGHGTHVAGTVGGETYGVAKDVTLVGVRVLNCSGSGTWSGVIAGVDWVTGNAVKPAVANMSLGGGASASVDEAVSKSIAAGVSYAIAAGNGNQGGKEQDACGYSPARVPAAMTIGATTQSDTKTSWSNYGDCVDWFAPGSGITSAWIGGTNATKTISGTSMAAPHTAGAAALYLEKNPGAKAAAVREYLFARTTRDVVSSSKTTNNHLLYTLTDIDDGVDDVVDTNNPPTAKFTYSCADLACDFDATESTDSDGSISSYAWNFGDTATGTGETTQHTFGAADGYTVMLTVTDDDGATGTASQQVTVFASSSGGFTLTAEGYKVKGRHHVNLDWTGTSGTSVDVYENGFKVLALANTANDGTETYSTDRVGGGTFVYKVCGVGTTTDCSNDVTVTF